MKSAAALQYTLYVPSAKVTPDMRAELVAAAGGATFTAGYGMWRAPTGEVVGEPVSTLTVIVQPDWAGAVEPILERIAQELRNGGEASVIYTVETITIRWKGDL